MKKSLAIKVLIIGILGYALAQDDGRYRPSDDGKWVFLLSKLKIVGTQIKFYSIEDIDHRTMENTVEMMVDTFMKMWNMFQQQTDSVHQVDQISIQMWWQLEVEIDRCNQLFYPRLEPQQQGHRLSLYRLDKLHYQ